MQGVHTGLLQGRSLRYTRVGKLALYGTFSASVGPCLQPDLNMGCSGMKVCMLKHYSIHAVLPPWFYLAVYISILNVHCPKELPLEEEGMS